ncbi:MAG: MMPL family transporter [Gemmatimonadetes bacterium]|nr:MMPL family transporter [Gemmatimonadota bacterium]
MVTVLVFVVVFGLGMDYEVSAARVKEASDKTGNNEKATGGGLSAIASVITSAALIGGILVSVGLCPGAGDAVPGFGLAVAVLLDASRSSGCGALVPAIMHLAEWNCGQYRRKPKATTNSQRPVVRGRADWRGVAHHHGSTAW